MAQHFFSSATSTGVTIGATSTTIVSSNSGRCWLSITNDSTADIYISLGATAEMNKGILLTPGGVLIIEGDAPYKGAIYGICAAGSKNVCVCEA